MLKDAALMCAKCGDAMPGVYLQVGEQSIEPGMVIVCMVCGHVQIVGSDGQLRHLLETEWRCMLADPRGIEQLRQAQATLRRYRASKGN